MSTLEWRGPTPDRRGRMGISATVFDPWRLYYAGAGIGQCWVITTGPRRGMRKISLGRYETMEEAKLACEQHYAGLSKAA
jgi:hypothetical protein